jgi:hypothetical protein
MNYPQIIELIAQHTDCRLERAAQDSGGRMKDETLIRLAEETAKWLSQTITVNPAPQMVPSYNAFLTAAKANHPTNPFLNALHPLSSDSDAHPGDDLVTVGEMIALFGQVRIVLESLRETPT